MSLYLCIGDFLLLLMFSNWLLQHACDQLATNIEPGQSADWRWVYTHIPPIYRSRVKWWGGSTSPRHLTRIWHLCEPVERELLLL